MNKRFTKLIAALALLVFMTPSLVGWGQTRDEATYIFNSKSWGATLNGNAANWISGKDGNQFTSGRGVQVTTGASGANATSPSSFENVSQIVVTYSTNASAGAGSIAFQVGSNTAVSQNVTKTGGTSDRTLTYSFSPQQSGAVKLTVTCTTNSIYVKSVAITTGNVTPTCATPTFSPAAGTYTEAQTVSINCATENSTIYYTTDGTEPTTSSSVYSTPINVNADMTIKAMAVAEGYNNSAVATAEYTIEEPSFNQDWEGTMHGWSFVSVTGDQVWSIGTYSNNKYAKMSGYSNVNNANEDWCISPAFNLGDYTNPVLTFTTARSQHNGNELEVYFSNNYNGDPTAATWTQLACTLPAQPSSGYSEFTSSGIISLSSYSGSNCYIGFKYTSTTSAAATWELDDIVLANQPITPTITLTPSSIDLGNNNATDVQISKTFTVSQSNLTEGIVLSASIGNLNTTTIAQGAEDTEITWTYTPTEAGNINATITATSAGAETQTLTITGAAVAPVIGDRYEMVTEAPQDWSGCYIITGTNSSNYYALTGVSNNLGTTAAVSVIGNDIESNTTTDGYQVFVSQSENGYTLYMENVGYLCYSSSGNNLNASDSFTESTCEWTFSFSNNLVTLTNVGSDTRMLQFNYNSGNPRFACYTSNQVKLTLFKYTGTAVVTPSISAENVNIESDATSGSISYNIINGVEGGVISAETNDDWITLGTVGETIPFSCEANTGAERTATVTLTYTYNRETVEKEVTITQAAYVAPFEPALYTRATEIVSGQHYIIVGFNGADAYAMGQQNNNNRTAVIISEDSNTAVVTSESVADFVIESSDENYTINDGAGYLYAASSSSNYLRTQTTNDDNGVWAISFDSEDGHANVVAQGTNTRNVMQFNSSSSLFACYSSASQKEVYLYVKSNETPSTHTLTITGYASDDTKDGYYLIASPVSVNPATVAGMTEGDFDLYSYDDTEELEWRNYKTSAFNLTPGTGYLYAKKATTENPSYEFTLTGAPYAGQPIQLIQGWNLVGNPYGQTAYITNEYYMMNPEGNDLVPGEGNAIDVMQGIFVNATEAGTMTFSTENNAKAVEQVVMNVTRNRGTAIDRAIVRFDEGDQLPKFQLNPNNTKLYIAQGNKDYAIVRSAAQGEMPVSFRAAENGTYTLSIEAENVEMNYLHLIDNMTGMDVDLLATPNYTFEAKTTDYASRFRLVFSANGIDEQNAETFAFFNGSEWMVSNLGEATLQVVDVMGRVLSTETISGNAELNLNQPAGVYMLRLINGNDVKVQKVIVK